MNNAVHPTILASMASFVPRPQPVYKAPPLPKGMFGYCADDLITGHEVICHLDYEPAERQTWDDPGHPAITTLCAAYVRDVDVLELLSSEQVEQIEIAAALELEEQAAEAEGEARAERREYN